MLNNLLASAGWILDLAFFLILLAGTAYGAYRGFVHGILKLAGTIFALVFAFFFCVSFANSLETCFHMTSAITTGISGAIAKNGAYGTAFLNDVAGADLSDALAQIGIGAIPRWLIARSFGGVEVIPAGTTPALLIGSVLAKWISMAISFLLLFLIIKFGTILINKLFSAIKDSVPPIRVVDQALGGVLGLVKACILIFILLLICTWLPFEGLHSFISSAGIVGKIFNSDWFANATSYAISGQWFTDYMQKLF